MTANKLSFIIALSLMLLTSGSLLSQKEIAHVYGQLKDEVTKKRLDDVVVMVFKDGALAENLNTGTSGKYDIELNLGYMILNLILVTPTILNFLNPDTYRKSSE